MEERRNLLPHYLIRATLLGCFSLYIVHLVKADKLQYYIVPRMIPYVKYGAMALFLLAGFYLFIAVQRGGSGAEEDCDCGHEPPRSILRNGMIYGLFAIPLLLGFMLPDRIMGSEVVAVKGMNLNVATVTQRPSIPVQPVDAIEPVTTSEPLGEMPNNNLDTTASDPKDVVEAQPSAHDELDKLFPADEFSIDYAELGKKLYKRDVIPIKTVGFLEMLTMLDLFKENFIGKEIVISGFVYRENDMKKDQFVVSRMAMQCCSADAMPYGFLVKSANGATLKKDTWITMTGKLSTVNYRGNDIIQLEAKKITVIKAPNDPYVYPYYDDFDELAKE
ncbi:TIGR03943 family protein [Cohnella endophytica]|uniref:TIGR03943 family protein n=1 Tax=Cohnella endophytica TaxID=2419778 RepID=A0A494Y7D6_9BACL|nr:TIGR03943 family protein [Cohnella endophytica]RKP58224.1 TIGR03943 family protein [Cohnella endophytica]